MEEPEVMKLNNFININGVKMTYPCEKLLEALSKMQGELDNAPKTSKNPYFNSRYADLATCLSALKKPMADNGLSVSQHCSYYSTSNNATANIECVTILGHSSGQMMISTLNVPVGKRDPQGIGMAITYARRYGLSSIVGLAQADDDAVSTVQHEQPGESVGTKEVSAYATENQVSMISTMLSKGNIPIEKILSRYHAANLESLTKEQASKCITILKKQVGE